MSEPATIADLRVAATLVAALAVLGALLGLAWAAWSPPGPAAQVLSGGRFIPDETEAFVAGDGRFLVLTAAAGLVAALLAWFVRAADRGAPALLGLLVGGGVGALLTELVGHLTGGGSFHGTMYRLTDGSTAEVTRAMPLSLHAQGLLFTEPLVIALVYGLLVSFAVHDDLGRPDPARDAILAARAPVPVGAPPADTYAQPVGQPYAAPASVQTGDHPQHGGGDGDAARALQQRDLPPQ